MDANAYARPYRGGLMVGAYETAPVEVDAAASPGGLPAGLASGPAALGERLGAVADVIPALAAATAVEVRAGVPTMSPDGTFVIDRAARHRGRLRGDGRQRDGPARHARRRRAARRRGSPTARGRRCWRRSGSTASPAATRPTLRAAALAQYATKYQHLDEPVSA